MKPPRNTPIDSDPKGDNKQNAPSAPDLGIAPRLLEFLRIPEKKAEEAEKILGGVRVYAYDARTLVLRGENGKEVMIEVGGLRNKYTMLGAFVGLFDGDVGRAERASELVVLYIDLSSIEEKLLEAKESGEEGRFEISMEEVHVTEREELAYQLYKAITSEKIIRNFFIVGERSFSLGLHCYDGVSYYGCEEEVRARLWELARKAGVDIERKAGRAVVNDAWARIEGHTMQKLEYEPLMIAFNNTLFDWEKFLKTGSIRASIVEPSPDLVVFHRIPHRLNLELLEKLEGLARWAEGLITNLEELAEKLCPKTLKAFKDWVGQKWALLFEIIGYTLYPRYDLHKAVMLIGEGSNGKSTYLRLLRNIVGPRNVASVSLQDLTDDSKRFTVAQLYHKLANIYADLPSTALGATGRFKILTGEDAICADRKFRDPVCFTNYAKLIFSTNELPRVFDMTEAFWRRWIVIEFPNKFPRDPTFYERTFTEEEVEGAIIVSLHAFRNAWLRRSFSFEGTAADYKEYWLRATDSVYAFLSDLLSGALVETLGASAARDDQSRVDADTLYNLYIRYCELEEREPLSKSAFTQALARHGIKRVFVHGARYYKGLKIEQKGGRAGGLAPE